MNSNYISTQSLYDSGAHLSHARQYSHKYVKREPDGHGGYRYYYKTDFNLGSGTANSVSRESSRNNRAYVYGNNFTKPNTASVTPKYARQAAKASQIYREGQHQNEKDYQARVNQASNETKPKVSKEYQEELEANSRSNNSKPTVSGSQKVTTWDNANVKTFDDEYSKALESNSQKNNYFGQGSNPDIINFPSNTPKNERKSIGDYAKQAVDTISTTAGSLYDKGKNFLKNIF